MGLISRAVESLIKPLAVRALLAWERRESGVAYDLTSPQVRTDPYDTYPACARSIPFTACAW